MARSFSDSPDFNLQDNVLNVYLPVLPKYKELMQELMDLKAPKIRHCDGDTLIAVEWVFRGNAVDRVLRNNKWQDMIKGSQL